MRVLGLLVLAFAGCEGAEPPPPSVRWADTAVETDCGLPVDVADAAFAAFVEAAVVEELERWGRDRICFSRVTDRGPTGGAWVRYEAETGVLRVQRPGTYGGIPTAFREHLGLEVAAAVAIEAGLMTAEEDPRWPAADFARDVGSGRLSAGEFSDPRRPVVGWWIDASETERLFLLRVATACGEPDWIARLEALDAFLGRETLTVPPLTPIGEVFTEQGAIEVALPELASLRSDDDGIWVVSDLDVAGRDRLLDVRTGAWVDEPFSFRSPGPQAPLPEWAGPEEGHRLTYSTQSPDGSAWSLVWWPGTGSRHGLLGMTPPGEATRWLDTCPASDLTRLVDLGGGAWPLTSRPLASFADLDPVWFIAVDGDRLRWWRRP